MDILDNKYTENGTWEKDGVLMCSKECCGQPVSECTCGSECKHCNCYELNKTKADESGYNMRPGNAMGRDQNDDYSNMNKRLQNRQQDQNREIQIKQASQMRRQNRLAKKIPTGLPQRILNPQPAGNQQ